MSALRQGWDSLRRHWPPFLAIHLTAHLFVAAVLAPLLSLVLGWLVFASGNAALTDQDILRAFLSPLGFVLFLVGAALVISVAVFSSSAMMLAAWRLRQAGSVSLWRLWRLVLKRFPDIFRVALRMALQALLLAAPFLALAAWAFLRWLTEYDINYYLDARPPVFWKAGAVIVASLAVMSVVLLLRVSGWVLALPLLLFGHGHPGQVLAMSRDWVAPRRGRVILLLAAWAVAAAALFALAGLGLDATAGALVVLAGDSLLTLAWLSGGLLLAWSAVNFLIGWLAGVALVLFVLSLYESLAPSAPAPSVRALAPLEGGAVVRRSGRWLVVAGVLATVLAAVALHSLLDELGRTAVPDVVAHRGASWDAPENTLASIRTAIEQGADWVEIDVQETREGEVVVIHDRDLMKVAGRPLGVWATPLEELRSVDIGSGKDPRFTEERVPLLSEVLALAKGRVGLIIELKYYGREERLEARVAELVEAQGMAEEVTFMSLNLPGVRAMQRLRPGWTAGLLSSVSVGDVTRLGVDFFAVNAGFVNRDFVDRAHRRGKRVLAWTVNDAAGMSALMSKGVDGIITDRPGMARDVLSQQAELAPHERLLVLFASELGSEFGESP